MITFWDVVTGGHHPEVRHWRYWGKARPGGSSGGCGCGMRPWVGSGAASLGWVGLSRVEAEAGAG